MRGPMSRLRPRLPIRPSLNVTLSSSGRQLVGRLAGPPAQVSQRAGLYVDLALLGDVYMGVSPGPAQCAGLSSASALAATWATTSRRLQPGNAMGPN
jgi:hypothetical protein